MSNRQTFAAKNGTNMKPEERATEGKAAALNALPGQEPGGAFSYVQWRE
jgi:hypothetical protein